MTVGPFATRLVFSVSAVAMLTSTPLLLDASAGDEQAAIARHSDHREQGGAFIELVREVTHPYKDPREAERAGYVATFGCVSGSDEGAMGVHMINFAKVMDPALDPRDPEILIYEPARDGSLRLTGADYLVFAEDWHKANGAAPPELMGQLFHLFESPNRFGLNPFYTLHVWAWKENPSGAFVNWHPKVSCTGFNPDM
jgi:hypothetical protein